MRILATLMLFAVSCALPAQRLRHALLSAGGKSRQGVTAIVRCTDRDVLEANGCRVLATFSDSIYITRIPVRQLNILSRSREVKRIEINKPCSADMDTTRTLLHVDDMMTPEITTGKDLSHVVVGVQDVGFDLTHPTFFSPDGTYRVKRFWDMVDTLHTDTMLSVGREYVTQESILEKGHATDGLLIAHGTHTAGIAAGSGWNGNAVTPYSLYSDGQKLPDLVLVSNAVSEDIEIIPDSLEDLYTTALDLLGFKYIFDYADSVGKPCVINFSEGSHQDFYDNILYDEVLRQITGPGHIIVASAGNEGTKLSYLDKPKGMKEARSLYYSNSPQAFVTLRSDSNINVRIAFDALAADPFVYEIKSKDAVDDSTYVDTLTVSGAQYAISYTFYPNCYDSIHVAGELLVENLSHPAFGSAMQRVALGLFDEGGEPSCHQEMFYYLGQFWDLPELPTQAVCTHNIHFPSSSEAVISVGGTAYRKGAVNYLGEWMEAERVSNGGGLYSASSVGPALNGLVKPDIVAPGVNIVSSYSSFYIEENPDAYDTKWDVEHFSWNGRTYAWNANTGTSMSAPVVTAIIAQWLSLCPTLTTEQIIETFAATSQQAKDNIRGYGEIDAVAGIEYIASHFAPTDGISRVNVYGDAAHTHNGGPLFDLTGRRIDGKPTHGIYIKDGKKILIK